jgi:hypothetical protein
LYQNETEDDIYNFITACDLVVSAVDEKHVPFLIKYRDVSK